MRVIYAVVAEYSDHSGSKIIRSFSSKLAAEQLVSDLKQVTATTFEISIVEVEHEGFG